MDKQLRKQAGFSLIEVLIATVILAVGLLGLAATQTLSMKHNNSGILKSNALGFSTKIADSIRANRLAARSYEVEIKADAEPMELPNCFAAEGGCTSLTKEEMSQVDTYYWQKELQAIYPSGEIRIAMLEDNDPADIDILLEVTLSWDKREASRVDDNTEVSDDAALMAKRESYVFQVRP